MNTFHPQAASRRHAGREAQRHARRPRARAGRAAIALAGVMVLGLGLASTPAGNLLVVDTGNNVIRCAIEKAGP